MNPKLVLSDAEAEDFLDYLYQSRKQKKKSFAEILEEAIQFWINKQKREMER